MVAGLSVRDSEGRPPLARSRSHTDPSSHTAPSEQPPIAATTHQSRQRPSHGRSHSYLSPAEAKPRNAQTLPSEKTFLPEKTSRLHIPGSNREHRHGLRHRHTQSEAHSDSQYAKKGHKGDSHEDMAHLVASLNAERAKHNLSRQPTNSEVWKSRANDFVRIASTGPYRGQNPPGMLVGDAAFGPADFSHSRLRAMSDPKAQRPRPAKTWIEEALERADAKKAAERRAVRTADVERMQNDLLDAQSELRDRLADVGRVSGDITRRLDYTYYGLLEKIGNLIGTIQSFQTLSEQSRQLIKNFEEETGKLDEDINKRVKRFTGGFDDREDRIVGLEQRATRASEKAQDLQTRLHNVRTVVDNWEQREDAAQKKWFRVWVGIWWGGVLLSTLLAFTFLWNEWWFRGDPVMAGLGIHHPALQRQNGNTSLAMHVPEDVMEVLESIEERRVGRRAFMKVPEKIELDREENRDPRLTAFDEL